MQYNDLGVGWGERAGAASTHVEEIPARCAVRVCPESETACGVRRDRRGTWAMLSRFERMLIGRYLLPGVGGRIVLLVAAIGMLGVTIGVASLILVMSVMNGAEARLVQQFASIDGDASIRSEEHTSALQSLMRISYAVSCLKKNTQYIYKALTNNIKT